MIRCLPPAGQDGTLQSFSTVHERFNKNLGHGQFNRLAVWQLVMWCGFHSSGESRTQSILDYLIEVWLCDLSRIHQQKEGAEKEEGALVRRAASSCHHGVFLWWDTHRTPSRKFINYLLLWLIIFWFSQQLIDKFSLDWQLLLVSQTGTALSRVIVVDEQPLHGTTSGAPWVLTTCSHQSLKETPLLLYGHCYTCFSKLLPPLSLRVTWHPVCL